jgi:hypothetical protein
MRLVPYWRRLWRAFSVQAMTLAAAIQGVWPTIPVDMKATIPPNAVHWVSMLLLIAGILGRMIDQPKARGQ